MYLFSFGLRSFGCSELFDDGVYATADDDDDDNNTDVGVGRAILWKPFQSCCSVQSNLSLSSFVAYVAGAFIAVMTSVFCSTDYFSLSLYFFPI